MTENNMTKNEMKYPSLSVAAYIAKLCSDLRYDCNKTKIQKLLYCCYGCVLVKYKKRLCDEYPRAWQYGPVFPRVFNHMDKDRPWSTGTFEADAADELKVFLREVVEVFGKYSAKSLSDWTHEPGSPWSVVVEEMGEENDNFIPDDLIYDYFLKNKIVAQNRP